MSEYIVEAARQTPVWRSVDVVVVGGGPAGLIAAAAAARNGASTVLVEQTGCLGGMATSGLVLTLGGFYSWNETHERVVDGLPGELLAHLRQLDGVRDSDGVVLDFDPEAFKFAADQFVMTAGVTPLFHALGVAPWLGADGVQGVIIESKSGRQVVRAKVVIDATGDADLAYRAGVPCEKSPTLQPATLCFMLNGLTQNLPARERLAETAGAGESPEVGSEISAAARVEWEKLRWTLQNPLYETPPNRFLRDRMQPARERGELASFGGPWGLGLYADEVWFNVTRQYIDATEAESLTQGELGGRRQAREIVDFWRRQIPGFAHSRLQQTASHLGIRETRRIGGKAVLDADTILAHSRRDDAIALGCWPIDVHPAGDDSYARQHLPHVGGTPRPYGIPYGCLVPREVDGLLVAGRCVSATREGQGSLRVMGTCMALGQAAGTAAALAVQAGLPPRRLDCRALRARLREQNAILGD